jgi:hypothetical protein
LISTSQALQQIPFKWYWESDGKYYCVVLHKDLFGIWVLTKYWGRRFTKLGNTKQLTLLRYDEHIAIINQIDKRRKARGYQFTIHF